MPPSSLPFDTPAAMPSPRLCALYVEDNEYLREVIGMLLEEENLEVDSVATGEAGDAAYDASRHHLLITDVSLPKMSGTELARRVRQRNPDAWIVFSSGYLLDHGLAQFGPKVRSLTKPFEVEQLQALLAEVRADLGAGEPRVS